MENKSCDNCYFDTHEFFSVWGYAQCNGCCDGSEGSSEFVNWEDDKGLPHYKHDEEI